MVNSADVLAYNIEGAIYCNECVTPEEKQGDALEGIGGPIFAEYLDDYSQCCAGCNHTIGCVERLGALDEFCPACDLEH